MELISFIGTCLIWYFIALLFVIIVCGLILIKAEFCDKRKEKREEIKLIDELNSFFEEHTLQMPVSIGKCV